jgi:hypothetical protein
MGRPSKYPEEFRREAVALALSTEESRASVARRLGVNETTLRNWVADHVAEELAGVIVEIHERSRGPMGRPGCRPNWLAWGGVVAANGSPA